MSLFLCFGFFFCFVFMYYMIFFFFFQAEDGIRDLTVTGVQTCALLLAYQVVPDLAERLWVVDVAAFREGFGWFGPGRRRGEPVGDPLLVGGAFEQDRGYGGDLQGGSGGDDAVVDQEHRWRGSEAGCDLLAEVGGADEVGCVGEARQVGRDEVGGRVADRKQWPAGRREGDRVRRVGVHDTADVGPGGHDLGVDGILAVPAAGTFEDFAGGADELDAVWGDLLQPPPAGLHPDAAAARITG